MDDEKFIMTVRKATTCVVDENGNEIEQSPDVARDEEEEAVTQSRSPKRRKD